MIHSATLAILVFACVWLSSAAPAASQNQKAIAKAVNSIKNAKGLAAADRQLKRGKREIFASSPENPENELVDQLSDLSDDQLRMLSSYLAQEISLLNPENVIDEEAPLMVVDEDPSQDIYEIVEVPDEILEEPLIFSRNERSVDMDESDDIPDISDMEDEVAVPVIIEQVVPLEDDDNFSEIDDQLETPLLIPEPVLEKVIEEEMDEMELESRIREIANVLNERLRRESIEI